MPAPSCPPTDDLRQLLDDGATDADQAELTSHLDKCGSPVGAGWKS